MGAWFKLTGNYLKSLQLAKQLEQRAKEATKNKKLAEKEREALQDLIDLCEESDVDLSGVDRLLSEFSAAINAKDYQTAIGHARKAIESARNAYIQKIADVADSVDAVLKLITSTESESKGALEMLEKSKELVLKDELQDAMKQARSAYDAAERTFHEHFSLKYSQAQETVNQAKEMGDDVSLFEDLLSRSKSALEKQDYEGGISQLNEALEGAGENVRSQIEDAISKAEDLTRAGQGIEADMARVESHVERARAALETLKYRDALSYSKRAESDAEKAISSRLSDGIREFREDIKSAQTIDKDSQESRDLLDKAQEAIKDKRFLDAIDIFENAKKKKHEANFQAVLGVIAKAKDKFVLAKKVGVDMSKALELLNTSRKSLRKGDFDDAIRLAEESGEAVENSLQSFYRARDELVELTKIIKLMKSIGQDIADVGSRLEEAKKSFEDRDYEKSSEASSEGISGARERVYEIAREKIDSADGIVKLGKSIGADIAEAEADLAKAAEAISSENLSNAIHLASESLDAANNATSAALNARLRSLDQFVDGFAKQDEIIDDVRDKIAEARQFLGTGDLFSTNDLLGEITVRIENVGREECEKLLTSARERLNVAESLGADTKAVEEAFTIIDELIEKKSYDETMVKIKEAKEQADEVSFRFLQAEFSSAKDALEEAQSLGIDVSDSRKQLKEARAKAESQNFIDSHEMVASLKKTVDSAITRHEMIKDKIRKAEGLIQEALASKANVAGLDEPLEKARRLLTEGRIDDAEAKLDNLIDETEKRLAMYLAAKHILASKENIELSMSHGLDVQEAQELLSKAKESMKNKSYDEALELSRESDEFAQRALAEGVEVLVKELRRMITEAKNVSMDTAGAEKLVEKASVLATNDDYAEALRCLDSAKEDIDHIRNLNAHATTEIKTARTNLKEAEMLNMDVGQAREMLEQAVDALTRHQYAIALELAKKSSETSIEITKASVWKTLEDFKERISKASEEGVYVGTAERCVAEGIEAFNDKRYQDSLKLAMKCEAEMERAELQKEISTKAVENARKKVTGAEAEGIKSDSAVNKVEEAERLLAKGRYTDALVSAIETGDILHNIREHYDRARLELSAVREQLERLKKVKIDTSECDEILDISREHLSSQDFEKFSDTLARCSAKVGDLFENSVSNLMEKSTEKISLAKSLGINTKACEDLLEVAKTSFSEKLWDFAYQQAEECGSKCGELIDKKLGGLFADAGARLDALGHLGAGVKTIQESMDVAKGFCEAGDHVKAFDILMEVDQRIASIEDSNREFIDISIAAESAIENLKRLGGQIREAERLLALADLEKEKDYDSAIELVAEALDTAQTDLESYAPNIDGVIETEGLYQDQEGQITLVLRNSGKAEARAITAEMSGEFEVISIQSLTSIGPGSEERLTAKVVPKLDGELSISANVSSKRPFDAITDTVEVKGKLEVYPAGPPFKITRAKSVAKCEVCKGKIKEGFDVVSCRCGSQHHLTCAKRFKTCPVCSQDFKF
ncbi:MAG: hypothetical protein JSV94_02035 [Methanobacteriota archaeon]|nr:MAG: hypothetical protein JSV94_02035 [Euryarchaeota archaeon]